jgi:uncharacterized protein with GYD domain
VYSVYLLEEKEGEAMPNYIALFRLTDQGIKAIKDSPGRIEAGIKPFQQKEAKLISFCTVMGECDYGAIGQAPSDEVATAFSLAMGSLGNVRTATMEAYTKEEFAAMLKKLPQR